MFSELADIVDAAAFLYLQAHSLVAEAHVCAPFLSPRILKSQTCGCCLELRVFHVQTSITQHETEQVSDVVQGWLLIEVIASRFLCRMKAAFFPRQFTA